MSKPTANITVDKSRLKIHDTKNVYLKDGENFEFELFNPSQKTVLASISIDGEKISQSGIVLNPGQRVYLDRYLDTPNKFKFKTYEVEANNEEVDFAISKNGLVSVSFYDEIVPIQKPKNVLYRSFGNVSNSVTLDNFKSSGTFYSQSNDTVSSTSILRSKSVTSDYKDDTLSFKETGKIEAGGKSDQTFQRVNKEFSSWASWSVEYKILPQSQKPKEVKDLQYYCPSCGKKIKPNWKFCTKCGEKLD